MGRIIRKKTLLRDIPCSIPQPNINTNSKQFCFSETLKAKKNSTNIFEGPIKL